MFSYYGSKSKVVKYYPPPIHDHIIEPFAGSARYSLRYWQHKVTLIENYELLVNLWHWLQKCEPKDILELPSMERGETTDDYKFSCQEAKWMMGFMVQQGVNAPRKTVSSVGNFGKCIERDKIRIAGDLHKIKHWTIVHGDYRDVDNYYPKTWFIDPPYKRGGEYYRTGNKHIDYKELAKWCIDRNGQTIVCENSRGGDWLPFKHLREMRGSKKTTTEVVWYG